MASSSLSPGNQQHSFVCPYCGECTMEQFFSDDGCPKKVISEPERRVFFPYLDLSGLDEADRIDLEDRLKYDTREMIFLFANFTLDVKRSIENDLQTPLVLIKDSVLSLEAFSEDIGIKVIDEDDRQKIKAARTLSDVFITLRNYISFFNYHIVEYIIHKHGSSEDHQRLEDYLESYSNYGKRNIFEVPQDVFISKSRKNAKVIALKCSERVSTMNAIETAKNEVSQVFGLRSLALQLCSIGKGCVELHFIVSAAVADHVFPVSPSQSSALSAYGISILFCRNLSNEKEKG